MGVENIAEAETLRRLRPPKPLTIQRRGNDIAAAPFQGVGEGKGVSWTKTSWYPLSSPSTRSVDPDWKAKTKPSELITGAPAPAFPGPPVEEMFTRMVRAVARS